VLWRNGSGITFHERTNVSNVWKAVLSLLAELEEGDLVLVEALYPSYCQQNAGNAKWSATKENSNRVCATVCRGADNVPRMTSVSKHRSVLLLMTCVLYINLIKPVRFRLC
jgi:hypothetical protein